jgi:hypothetical protein
MKTQLCGTRDVIAIVVRVEMRFGGATPAGDGSPQNVAPRARFAVYVTKKQ